MFEELTLLHWLVTELSLSHIVRHVLRHRALEYHRDRTAASSYWATCNWHRRCDLRCCNTRPHIFRYCPCCGRSLISRCSTLGLTSGHDRCSPRSLLWEPIWATSNW